jgi:putative membrane protein
VVESSFDYIEMVLPIFIVIYTLMSVGLSLFFVVIKYFNLIVFVSDKGLSVKSGLFKVEDSFVPLKKIQIIKWKSNPLQRLLGYRSLFIYQASSEAIKRKSAVMVPGCLQTHWSQITHKFYSEFETDEAKFSLSPEPFWKLRLYAFFVVLPLIGIGPGIYFELNELLIGIGVYFILSALLVYKYTANYKVTISQNLVELNKGYIFTEQVFLKVFKVQNVAVKQNIFQKRRGLVSLKIYTASGNLNIPYIKEELGFSLANKLLYDVESSRKSWM